MFSASRTGRNEVLVTDDVHPVQQDRHFRIVPPPALPRRATAAAAGATAIVAPLAGTISAIRVRVGEAIELGQVVLLLDTMKMEHRIIARTAGVVNAIHAEVGAVVSEGAVLVELSQGD
jgi:biotin carboxyl carrier protein